MKNKKHPYKIDSLKMSALLEKQKEILSFSYDAAGNTYNIGFTEDNFNFYSLKIFPQLDIFELTLPNTKIISCSLQLSPLEKNFDYLVKEELYTWLLKIISEFKTEQSLKNIEDKK